nr:glycosyltransferase N-terminal domain-containing protein [Frigidibacter albus]
MVLRLFWRRLRGREPAGALAERLGRAPRADGPALWLHGASNGELTSARALLASLIAEAPGLRVLVTANTLTARKMVEGWALPGVTAALAPLDHRLVLRRFLARARPAALVVMENEFWPNRLAACAQAGIPVLVIGARMSARSARRWTRLPSLARPLVQAIHLLSAQDAASEAHFRQLGLPADRIGPALNLKAGLAPDVPAAELRRLAPLFDRSRTLLAASTHAGEEAPVLEAFAQLWRADPARRLILAPRHPRRSDEVAALIAAAGLGFARRSRAELPGPQAPVLLGDTMGDMPLWYALAGVTFVGGSLVDKGGHTPFEPAAQASAILHGPHTGNAAEAYAALQAAGGALLVTDAASLVAAVASLDADRQAQQAAAARHALTPAVADAAQRQLRTAILAACPAAVLPAP